MEIGQTMLKQGKYSSIQLSVKDVIVADIKDLLSHLTNKRPHGKSQRKEMFTNIILSLPK